MKLSILIPTTPDRKHFLQNLLAQFDEQLTLPIARKIIEMSSSHLIDRITYGEVEVIIFRDEKQFSIGRKRNRILSEARGEYIAFIDDDDRIGDNYFKHAFAGIDKGVDACGLTGIITEDGQNPKKFVHSMLYDSWYEKDNVYYRNNNHLNVVKRSIANQMKFPETNHGEDKSYSEQLLASGLITFEYWDQDEVLYFYDWRKK